MTDLTNKWYQAIRVSPDEQMTDDEESGSSRSSGRGSSRGSASTMGAIAIAVGDGMSTAGGSRSSSQSNLCAK